MPWVYIREGGGWAFGTFLAQLERLMEPRSCSWAYYHRKGINAFHEAPSGEARSQFFCGGNWAYRFGLRPNNCTAKPVMHFYVFGFRLVRYDDEVMLLLVVSARWQSVVAIICGQAIPVMDVRFENEIKVTIQRISLSLLDKCIIELSVLVEDNWIVFWYDFLTGIKMLSEETWEWNSSDADKFFLLGNVLVPTLINSSS